MTGQKIKQEKAPQFSLNSSLDNFPQLDNNLAFPEFILNNVVKDSSHISRLIFLAQAAIEIDKDHQSRNKNPNLIDVPLIIQL